jgi:epoxyqueuosine reductase
VKPHKYLVRTESLKRFDQKNEAFKRAATRDGPLKDAGDRYYGTLRVPTGKKWEEPGITLKDYAYAMGSYYVERMCGRGHYIGNYGLLKWEEDTEEQTKINRMTPGFKYVVKDPAKMSQDIKKAAKKLGASEAGICELNPLWVYSMAFHPVSQEHFPLEIDPNVYRYAIVFVIEMDYEAMHTSASHLSYATSAYAYSRIVDIAGQMAHFIRTLGYEAIPSENDTALNIPLAIDAGLGQLGRNGLLITPRWGPRVRIGKILTSLPLSADNPISFGVDRFCNVCKRCAESCPSQAISFGELTDKPVNISTSPGVYKWPINAEKCFSYWGQRMRECSVCIRVCPFNKPEGILHTLVRFIVKYMPWFDRALVRLDKLFGYGKCINAQRFWAD